jgi:hypothetical protein
MRQIQDEYSKLIYGGDVRPPSRIAFIGPSSVTLQIKNIAPVGAYKMPSIRKNYSVTDKADGLRKLLFISTGGKMYLIDPLLNVQFTGLVVDIKAFHNTLLDGEHVLHDKNGAFINLYLAFDIYFLKGESVRERSFYTSNKEHADKSRHSEMLKYIANMDAKPILKSAKSPLAVQCKRFYFDDEKCIRTNFCAMQTMLGKRIQVCNRWSHFHTLQYRSWWNRTRTGWSSRSEIHMGAFIQMEAAAV